MAKHRFELSVLSSLLVLSGLGMISFSPALGPYPDSFGLLLSFSGFLILLFLVQHYFENGLNGS